MSENRITLELLKLFKIDIEEPWINVSSIVLWVYLVSLDELSHLTDDMKDTVRTLVNENRNQDDDSEVIPSRSIGK